MIGNSARQLVMDGVGSRSNNVVSRNTSSVVTKNDIINMANQISNESLLSKTDILESQIDASKRALVPKFNASGNPFIPLEGGGYKSSNLHSMTQSKVELAANQK